MIIPRVIPCLLVEDGGMVKTRQFSGRTYLGDPVNVLSLFNNFEVDEIVLLDIGATRRGMGPDFELMATLAEECWVPLTYGGGVSSLDHIETLIHAGCEKVVLASAVADDLTLMREASRVFGAQAIVGSIDVKHRPFRGYRTVVANAKRGLPVSPVERARQFAEAGAGEILLQSVDRDGEMSGYDLKLISEVASATDLPIVACSGAGAREDLPKPIVVAGASASAAGSLFVFSGRERGVLVNFPERSTLEALFCRE
jgi:imidazole glycerol-phosphate synthase subunit HisF